MKKKTWTMLGLLLLILPSVLGIWGFILPAQYRETFLGELPEKVRILDETDGKRIVFVGGSAVAFGVDCAAVERELPDYKAVNFGMYAALGTTVMFDLSKPSIHEGDIVVVIPEIQTQSLSGAFDPDVMWQGLDGNSSLLLRLPADKIKALIGAFPHFAGQKFSYYISHSAPDSGKVYRRGSFNRYGDIESAFCQENIMDGGWDSSMPIELTDDLLDQEFVTAINQYASFLQRSGAKVWFAFCPMNQRAVCGDRTLEQVYDSFHSKLDVPMIGDPHDSVLEAEWFFDTNFHLNQSGRQVYTYTLIENIKAMLGDCSATQLEMPDMPAMAGTYSWQGDDTDEMLFEYEEDGDTLAVTGLTEEGKKKRRLVVPSVHQGKQVTSIHTGALSEARDAEEIIVQQNIRTIQDGAFFSCNRLESIRLEQTDPTVCKAGQDLLRGTAAKILVPASALSRYRTDYTWSLYADRIFADSAPQ